MNELQGIFSMGVTGYISCGPLHHSFQDTALVTEIEGIGMKGQNGEEEGREELPLQGWCLRSRAEDSQLLGCVFRHGIMSSSTKMRDPGGGSSQQVANCIDIQFSSPSEGILL